MYTLIWSDGEGWNVVEQFKTREEVDICLQEEIGSQEKCSEHWYNPAPIIIHPDYTVEKVEGYRHF